MAAVNISSFPTQGFIPINLAIPDTICPPFQRTQSPQQADTPSPQPITETRVKVIAPLPSSIGNTMGWLRVGLEGVVNGKFGQSLQQHFLSCDPHKLDKDILIRIMLVSWLCCGANNKRPEVFESSNFQSVLSQVANPNATSQLNPVISEMLIRNDLQSLKGDLLKYAEAINHIVSHALISDEGMAQMKKFAVVCHKQGAHFIKVTQMRNKINFIKNAVEHVAKEISHIPNQEMQMKMRAALSNAVAAAMPSQMQQTAPRFTPPRVSVPDSPMGPPIKMLRQ